MKQSMPTRGATTVALIVSSALFAASSTLWESRLVGGLLALLAAASMLWPTKPRSDHDSCLACTHHRVEHHGICQACQRDVVRGAPGAPTFACERFSLR